jgi:hypothetical protein
MSRRIAPGRAVEVEKGEGAPCLIVRRSIMLRAVERHPVPIFKGALSRGARAGKSWLPITTGCEAEGISL